MHCAKCYFYETAVGDEVCNRCGRAYLPQANLYLGLLLLVTGGMAWTLRHLLTGSTDPLVRPEIDLGAWVTWPVSIVDSPAYGLVLGAWLGMLGAAPILTGLLYGKRGGLLLVIAMAALGPSVMMAAAVALGVWIAAGWTTRLSSKLSSAMLGLVPVAIYWFTATALTDFSKGEAPGPPGLTDAAAMTETWRTLAPALRPLAYVAPVTAVVAAAAAVAIVVAIAWADRWHVRWPGAVVAVLTAGPVMALLALVGVDEVRHGMFLQRGARQAILAADGKVEIVQLQEFLRRHPTSRHAAQVRARLAEDIEKIERDVRPQGAALNVPGVKASSDVWLDVIAKNPASPWAADGGLHLGDDDARQGLFDLAEEHYRDALARTSRTDPVPEDPLTKFNVVWNLFSIGPALRAREAAEHLDAIRQEALFRLAVLQDNRKDSQDNSKALALYFIALGQKGTNRYREGLAAVRDIDQKGALADNVAYDLAMLEADDAKRIELLRAVATAWAGTDGAMLAHLKTAQGLIARAATDPGALREAKQHLLTVQAELAARRARRASDPYVASLGDRVEKELIYVEAQLRAPTVKP